MKRTIRPLFSVFLFIAVALTLAVRITLRYSSIIELKAETPFSVKAKKSILNVNETLLQYAAIDIGEPQLKKEVEELLEGKFRTHSRHRSFLSSGKYHIDIRPRTARGIPVQLRRSPEFYRLWLSFRRNLQDWFRNRKSFKDVMLDLVNDVKIPIDGLKKRYKSCAVVGNSGILLKSEYGELIDSHEAVIRLNNARTGGFEHRVGSKTTISFVNSNILHLCARRDGCFCHPYGVNVAIVMYICQPVHFLDYMVCNSSHKAPLIISDPRFDMLCAKIVKYYSLKRFLKETGKSVQEWAPAHDGANFHYSSGFQAVMLALGVCEKVSVFGFGKSVSAKHHYHTNQRAELKLHDYDAEYDFYRDLVKRPQGWNLFPRRNLNDWEIETYCLLLQSLSSIVLDPHKGDSIKWKHNSTGAFSVKSCYKLFTACNSTSWPWRKIWYNKAPLKISCFSWLVAKEACLTQTNLQRRGMQLCSRCLLCEESPEDTPHLFLHCKMSYQIWSMFFAILGLSWTMPHSILDFLHSWGKGGLNKKAHKL